MAADNPLDPTLDGRLLTYSSRSPNAFEAIWTIQRMVRLIPVYARALEDLYGKAGIGEARRAWGRVADLCAGIVELPATMESLLKLKMDDAADVGHLLAPPDAFSLVGSAVFAKLEFGPARTGDMDSVLAKADLHDRIAKPLLDGLRDELRAIDLEALASTDPIGEATRVETFGELLRHLPGNVTEFPGWDGRPMFLDEQRLFLEYMGNHAAAEIVADHLVDEELGMFLLYASGHLRHDQASSRLSLEPSRVPHRMLGRPLSLVCHQIGDAVLEALGKRGHAIDPFERLFLAERAVIERFDLDISAAFSFNRVLLTEASFENISDRIVDLRTERKSKNIDARVFEFPDFGEAS